MLLVGSHEPRPSTQLMPSGQQNSLLHRFFPAQHFAAEQIGSASVHASKSKPLALSSTVDDQRDDY